MKILVISPNSLDACSFYRSIGPFTQLCKTHEVEMIDGASMKINWAVLKKIDIVFFSRPYRHEDYQIASLCKEMGIPIWVDFDDNLLEVGGHNERALIYNTESCKQIIGAVASLAEVITVTTESLVEVYSQYNVNIKVLPNALDESVMNPKSRPSTQHNLILYRGSSSHVIDLYEHTDELIDLIDDTFGWEWLFLGFNPWWIGHDSRTELTTYPHGTTKLKWLDGIDPFYYFKLIKTLAPLVMIVPLSDSKFNRGKSNIAWIEGTYIGAGVIAPEYLPEFDRPGVIRYKNHKDFKSKLGQTIKKQISLTKCNDESWEYIQDNLTLSKVNEQRYEITKELI